MDEQEHATMRTTMQTRDDVSLVRLPTQLPITTTLSHRHNSDQPSCRHARAAAQAAQGHQSLADDDLPARMSVVRLSARVFESSMRIFSWYAFRR